MADKKAQPRYLQNTVDGVEQIRVYDGKDIEAAQAHGWKEPTRRKSNGEPYNDPNQEADIVSAAANASEMAKLTAERNAKITERKDKEAEAARKDAEKARADAPADDRPRVPDFRVEVVNAADASATAAKKSK